MDEEILKNEGLNEEDIKDVDNIINDVVDEVMADVFKEVEEDEELQKEADDVFSKEDPEERYETMLKYHPEYKDGI